MSLLWCESSPCCRTLPIVHGFARLYCAAGIDIVITSASAYLEDMGQMLSSALRRLYSLVHTLRMADKPHQGLASRAPNILHGITLYHTHSIPYLFSGHGTILCALSCITVPVRRLHRRDPECQVGRFSRIRSTSSPAVSRMCSGPNCGFHPSLSSA